MSNIKSVTKAKIGDTVLFYQRGLKIGVVVKSGLSGDYRIQKKGGEISSIIPPYVFTTVEEALAFSLNEVDYWESEIRWLNKIGSIEEYGEI